MFPFFLVFLCVRERECVYEYVCVCVGGLVAKTIIQACVGVREIQYTLCSGKHIKVKFQGKSITPHT